MQPSSHSPQLHEIVERKLAKIFGEERGKLLLEGLLAELELPTIATTNDLARVADALEARPGFERTTGAVLSVMVTMRRSQGI